MRQMELWCDITPAEFATEFLTDASHRLEGRHGSGLLASTGQSVSAIRGPIRNQTAFKTLADTDRAFRVNFHETYAERNAVGLDGLDRGLAEFCVALCLDERFSQGILVDDQDTACLFLWSPAGQWLVDTTFPDTDRYAAHRWCADRAQKTFKPTVEDLLSAAGIPFGRKRFEHDWFTRRTEEHSIT